MCNRLNLTLFWWTLSFLLWSGEIFGKKLLVSAQGEGLCRSFRWEILWCAPSQLNFGSIKKSVETENHRPSIRKYAIVCTFDSVPGCEGDGRLWGSDPAGWGVPVVDWSIGLLRGAEGSRERCYCLAALCSISKIPIYNILWARRGDWFTRKVT